MKKVILTLLFLLPGILASANGGESKSEKGGWIDGEFTVSGLTGNNDTFGEFWGLDAKAQIDLWNHLELIATSERLSNDIDDVTATVRPKISLGKSLELYADVIFNDKCYKNCGIDYKMTAAGAGLVLFNIDGFVGLSKRIIHDMESSDQIEEAPELLYCGRILLRRRSARWNIGGGFSNFNPYCFERTWQPQAFGQAWVRCGKNFRLDMRVDIEQSGLFHMASNLYGLTARVGLTYIWR